MYRKKCLVGVNYTSTRHFSLIKELIRRGYVDYVEILIDNFLAVSAKSILEKFEGLPIAFHIMNSRFLEIDHQKLVDLSKPLKSLIREIQPLYVSDHIGCFSYNGCLMPVLGEYNYSNFQNAIESICRWQDLLGTQVLLENFPSYTHTGTNQPRFFRDIIRATGAGLLFDISNAIVAEHNANIPLSDWTMLTDGCCHFHAGGYSTSDYEPVMLLDTHDRKLSGVTAAAINQLLFKGQSETPTITIEFDRNIEIETWTEELQQISRLNFAPSL